LACALYAPAFFLEVALPRSSTRVAETLVVSAPNPTTASVLLSSR
jgi:hypothetical protein